MHASRKGYNRPHRLLGVGTAPTFVAYFCQILASEWMNRSCVEIGEFDTGRLRGLDDSRFILDEDRIASEHWANTLPNRGVPHARIGDLIAVSISDLPSVGGLDRECLYFLEQCVALNSSHLTIEFIARSHL